MSETSTVVLAHLSDVHLPPPSPLPTWRRFANKRALSVISWKRHRVHHHLPTLTDVVRSDIAAEKPDLILNTGDLTNFGLSEEFEAAAKWLETMSAPCLVVPGNHDAMVRQDWTANAGLLARWMEQTGESDFPYCSKKGNIAIIGLNSACPTLPFAAYGRVGKMQRDRLADMLDATRMHCRIILIHHPPRDGLVSRRKSLLDHHELNKTIAQHGAALVLHGHSHNATLATVDGTAIPVIGAPSASLHSHEPLRHCGWNRLAITRQETGWEIDLRTRQFTQEQGWQCSRHRTWLTKDARD